MKNKNLFDSPEIKLDGIEKFLVNLTEKVEKNNEIMNNHLSIFETTLGCLANDKLEIENLKKKLKLLFRISIGLSYAIFILFIYILFLM